MSYLQKILKRINRLGSGRSQIPGGSRNILLFEIKQKGPGAPLLSGMLAEELS